MKTSKKNYYLLNKNSMLKQTLKITSFLISLTFLPIPLILLPVLAQKEIVKIKTQSEKISIINSEQRTNLRYISGDGRYLAFRRSVATSEYTERYETILYDTTKGRTEIIGTEEYPVSWNLDVSGNGRYVAYISSGLGVVLYDRETKQYRNVVEDDNANTTDISISDNGRYIVFTTSSKYLERIIPEKLVSPSVLLYDTVENKLELISKSYDGQKSGNKPALNPSISSDGRFIILFIPKRSHIYKRLL